MVRAKLTARSAQEFALCRSPYGQRYWGVGAASESPAGAADEAAGAAGGGGGAVAAGGGGGGGGGGAASGCGSGRGSGPVDCVILTRSVRLVVETDIGSSRDRCRSTPPGANVLAVVAAASGSLENTLRNALSRSAAKLPREEPCAVGALSTAANTWGGSVMQVSTNKMHVNGTMAPPTTM